MNLRFSIGGVLQLARNAWDSASMSGAIYRLQQGDKTLTAEEVDNIVPTAQRLGFVLGAPILDAIRAYHEGSHGEPLDVTE
jgi:hypothetical protein